MDTTATVAPHIPGYTMSRPLGQGSSSTVWLATRDTDGARFAVKCAKAGADGDRATAQVLEDLSREMKLLSLLQHKHLIRVHEVLHVSGMAEGTRGIVMDYAAGGSLANLVSARGRLRIGEAVTILAPLAQALEYLHVNGTEHGDVSPGNVLFTAVGMPLLADLGITAKVGDRPRNPGVGTPGFMDPAADASEDGSTSRESLQPHRDVYSLGAVGWYCLTGTAPEQEQDRPPLSLLVPEVPKALAAALEAALDPDPRNRPTARELGTAIFRSAAPEALDLFGAVHSSVIPELLTRRETLGRSPRRTTLWWKTWRTLLPLRRRSALRRPGRPRRRHDSPGQGRSQGGPGNSFGIRLIALAVVGALIGVASWILWQQDRPTTATVHQAAMENGVADPGQEAELRDTDDVQDAQGLQDTQGLPDALFEALQSADPLLAVPALSAVRDMALGERRLDLLDSVNASGSPAEATDKQLSDYLRGAGTAFAGLHTTLTALTVEGPPQSDHVLVAVTATTSGYEERLASGTVVRTEGEGTPQQLRLDLVRSEGRWRISGILGAVSAG